MKPTVVHLVVIWEKQRCMASWLGTIGGPGCELTFRSGAGPVFNRALTDMLAKKMKKNGRDWDVQLPYELFEYWASVQESMKESPFFLLYGRDLRLPTEVACSPSPEDQNVDMDDFKSDLRSYWSVHSMGGSS